MNLFSLKFWFDLTPDPLSPTNEFILLSFFTALVMAAIILKIMNKKFDSYLIKIITRLRHLFLTMGIIGLFLLFFSYERAYILGSKFWYLFWGIGFLIWLGFILYDLLKKMPAEKKEKNRKESFEKYLPRPKSK